MPAVSFFFIVIFIPHEQKMANANMFTYMSISANTGLPQKKLIENPGLSRALFLIFQGICFINSRTFPGFFKKNISKSQDFPGILLG